MKTLSSLLSLCAIGTLLSSCGAGSPPAVPSAEELALIEPFTMTYDYTEERLRALTDNDSFGTLAFGGPLYTGAQSTIQPGLAQYAQLKKEAVARLMEDVRALHEANNAYYQHLTALRSLEDTVLAGALPLQPSAARSLKTYAVSSVNVRLETDASLARVASIPIPPNPPALEAHMQYQKLTATLESASHMMEETASRMATLLTLDQILTGLGTPEALALQKTLDTEASTLVDQIAASGADLALRMEDIDLTLRHLETADVALGKASALYMRESLVPLELHMQKLAPREGFSAEDLAFTKELLALYKEEITSLTSVLEGLNSPRLLPLTARPTHSGLLPTANAKGESYLGQAFDVLKAAGKSSIAATGDLASKSWGAAKTAARTLAQASGATLDTLAASAQSVKDVASGIYTKQSTKQILGNIKENFVIVRDNFQAGRSGSDILRTAGDYFESFDKAVGATAEAGVEKVMGKGWSSWLAGHAGKLTADMFTSLGKGITKVANTESTTGEILEGTLDIGLSFIGGTKALAKGSQVLKGTKESLVTVGKSGMNFLERLMVKGDISSLKGMSKEILSKTKLTPGEVKILVSNSIELEVKEALEAEMKQMAKNLDQQFLDLIKKAGKTIGNNATVEAKIAYKEFVETTFEHSLKGYRDALGKVLGTSATEYIDNLVEAKTGDLLKEMVKNLADKGVILGFPTAPKLEDLAGSWKDASMTVEEVYISDEFRRSSEAEGCDFSELEAQKGKKQSLGISLEPQGEEGGTMLLRIGDDDTRRVPFTYKDGVVTAGFTERGATMSISMTMIQEGDTIKAAGPLALDYMNGGIKLGAQASMSRPAPAPAQ